MIESIIDDLILSTPGITSKVGNRVRPLARDEKLPCISFKKDSETSELDISGKANGVTEASISITTYGRSFSESKTLSNNIKLHLLNQRGLYDNCAIHLVVFDGDDDDYDNESKIYLNDSNYTIYFEG